jgi:hypothetical protein
VGRWRAAAAGCFECSDGTGRCFSAFLELERRQLEERIRAEKKATAPVTTALNGLQPLRSVRAALFFRQRLSMASMSLRLLERFEGDVAPFHM